MGWCTCHGTATAVTLVLAAAVGLLSSVGDQTDGLTPLEAPEVSLGYEEATFVGRRCSSGLECKVSTSHSKLETLWVGRERQQSEADSKQRCLVVVVPGAPGLGVLYAGLLQALAAEQQRSRPEQRPCTGLALSYPRDPSAPPELEVVASHVAAALSSLLTDTEHWNGCVRLPSYESPRSRSTRTTRTGRCRAVHELGGG